VPVAIGSGGKIQTGSVVVTFHPVISGSSAAVSETDPLVVSSRPLAVPGYPDPAFLLDGFKDCQAQALPLPKPYPYPCHLLVPTLHGLIAVASRGNAPQLALRCDLGVLLLRVGCGMGGVVGGCGGFMCQFAVAQDGAAAMVEERMIVWQQASLVWTMPTVQEATGIPEKDVAAALALFMQRAAYPGDHATLGVSLDILPQRLRPVVGTLVEQGMAEERRARKDAVGRAAYFLTVEGVSAMQSAHGLADPRPIFAPRPEVALMDKTEFELIKELESAGWSWQEWVPVAKRRRGQALPDAYRDGEPKIWFSTAAVPPPSYMRALLQSEERGEGSVWPGWCILVATAAGASRDHCFRSLWRRLCPIIDPEVFPELSHFRLSHSMLDPNLVC
jgi:hypothetical protein